MRDEFCKAVLAHAQEGDGFVGDLHMAVITNNQGKAEIVMKELKILRSNLGIIYSDLQKEAIKSNQYLLAYKDDFERFCKSYSFRKEDFIQWLSIEI
ncbi:MULTISPECIES: hypothetical protein [Vibrio]|uniref:Uncharacterized protein n=3 Tax=Vibrio TaxID=662 RepID=A0A5Q6PES2_VIBCL|nr:MULTISPECIES: hypothetical protein [Vibrio]ARN69169.1 hypothetical protein FORC36_4652 [Vibrio vulnificus]EGR2217354.1 hypothetical protein [Vibrio parahaemolyticus]EGR2855237.1 hypothetical protein [Vibrio parahaemolyticus]EGR2987772.1 hypothetical protein [Vibrio parahaemolyticus]EGR5854659.1 hypothetical protein [Vibrio parahaemolyticus]